MTLNVDQWLANEISKTASIHHLDIKVWGGKTSKLKSAVRTAIRSEFGEKILESSDYILIFKGEVLEEADGIRKLFSVVDSSLGTNANNLTVGDFKRIEPKDDSDSFVFLQITLN